MKTFRELLIDRCTQKAHSLQRKLKSMEIVELAVELHGAGEPKARKPVGISNDLDDTAWILSLEKEPSLSGVNIRLEISKCDFWCRTNKKQRTRRRILNWLNKAERVVDAKAMGGSFANGLRPLPPAPPEPPHWRDVFPDYIYVHLPWNQIERSAQIYLSEQMKQRA